MFTCKICKKKFQYNSEFIRHKNRKTSCFKDKLKEGQRRTKKDKIGQFVFTPENAKTSMVAKNDQNQDTPEKGSFTLNKRFTSDSRVSCKYCGKPLEKSKINRHFRDFCMQISDELRNSYKQKFLSDKRTKHEIVIFEKNEKSEKKKAHFENLKNSKNVKNTPENNEFLVDDFTRKKEKSNFFVNYGNYNEMDNRNMISINNINNYDNDDYSHLTEDDIVKICGSGSNTYVVLFKYLMKNKKNYNYMIKNKKEDEIMVIKNNKIRMTNMRVLSVYKLSRLSDIILDIYDDNIREKLSKDKQDNINKILEDELDFENEYYKLKRQLSAYNYKTRNVFKSIDISKHLGL